MESVVAVNGTTAEPAMGCIPIGMLWPGAELDVVDLQHPGNSLYEATIGRDNDNRINNTFYCGCSKTGQDLNEGSNPALFPGMASKLFTNSFLQVQVDGLVLCGQVTSNSPLGYYCTITVPVVLSPLLSACLKSKLAGAKSWYILKAG
jgi:hypothetical protein